MSVARPPRRSLPGDSLPLPSPYPPVSATSSAASVSSAVSPSELKRRRVPASLPTSFALSDDDLNGTPGKGHDLDGYPDSEPLLSLANGSSSSSSSYSRRRSADPDDKYSDKPSSTTWRRLWAFLSPHSTPRSRLRSSNAASSSTSARALRAGRLLDLLYDRQRPCLTLVRVVLFASLCAFALLVATLLLRGGTTALLYLTHPLIHLTPSMLLLSSLNRTADGAALSPELSSSEFTIVASFFGNAQSAAASTRILQWHSLLAFVELTPPSHLLIYTNGPSDCADFLHRAFEELQCFQFTDALHADLNLPYVPALLAHAHAHAKTDLIVYAHHDILLAPALASSIHALVDAIPGHAFLATSRRIDFRLPPDMVFRKDFSVPLTEPIVGAGRAVGRTYFNEWNVDLLVYSRAHFARLLPLASMPAFVYADYYWANFVLSAFLLAGDVAVVDLSAQQLVIHQKTNDTQDGIAVTDVRGLYQHNLRVARNHSDHYLYGSLTNLPNALTGSCPACRLHPSTDASVLLLARRQALAGWLIVMDVDEARDSAAVWNWLCWAARANVSNFLLVSSSTDAAYRTMWEMGFPIASTVAGTGPPAAVVIDFVLQYAFNVLTMDWDHLLLQSPFPYLDASPFDVMLKGDEHNLYSGILALRSSHYSHYFWQLVLECRSLQRHVADASPRGVDCATSTYRDVRLLVKGGLLDLLHFPTVKSFFSDQLSQRTGMQPYVVETSPRVTELARLHIAGDDATCESAQRPPYPPLTGSYPTVVRVLTSSHVDHLKALLASLAAAQYDGATVDLEIAIDYPHANATDSERQGYHQVVELASTYQWSHGEVLVTLEDTERVGTARLLHADVDLERLAYVLAVTDEVVLSSMWYLSTRHLLSLFGDDSQLLALSLTNENVVLGETHAMRSSRRLAMDETAQAPPVYFWQRPSSALLFLPHQHSELLIWMRLMQATYPTYHPCVPTLITNHHGGWQEWVSKWLYVRGSYVLYTNWPQRSVLAVKKEEAALERRYVPALLNVKTFADMAITALQRASAEPLHVFDFHLRRVDAPLTLQSRAHVQALSKQCWVMDDWKSDEAAAPNMVEDELMTDAEEQRRRATRKRRHPVPASFAPANSSAGRPERELVGHAVSEQMVAGVRPVKKPASAKARAQAGKGTDSWAEAAAAAIAESTEHGAQEALREQQAANKNAPASPAAQPSPPSPAAAASPPAAAPNADKSNEAKPENRTALAQDKPATKQPTIEKTRSNKAAAAAPAAAAAAAAAKKPDIGKQPAKAAEKPSK